MPPGSSPIHGRLRIPGRFTVSAVPCLCTDSHHSGVSTSMAGSHYNALSYPDKVHGPPLVRTHRGWNGLSCRTFAPSRFLMRCTLVIDHQAFPLQHDVQPGLPMTGIPFYDAGRHHHPASAGTCRPRARRRPGPPLTQPKTLYGACCCHLPHLAPHFRSFLPVTDQLSNACWATICFRTPFSSSRDLSLFNSSASAQLGPLVEGAFAHPVPAAQLPCLGPLLRSGPL